MAVKKRGLGRGLDALLAGSKVSPEENNAGDQYELKDVPVDLIQRGKYQPRIDMHSDTLQELADSIKAQGVVQPIIIRPVDDRGRYEIIAGERRWRAAQLAGLQDIPAVIRDVNDQAAIAMALIENIQRENLNPMEESRALIRLIQEFELTHQQAAEAVGRSRASVSNLLRLLELQEDVMVMVEHGDIEMGHARALLSLDLLDQREAANTVVAHGLSVRETEKLVKKIRESKSMDDVKSTKKEDPNIKRLELSLSEQFATQVKIQHSAKGKGKLVIHYNNVDELDGILEQFHKSPEL